MTLSVKSDRPLPSLTVTVMREIDTLMKELNLSYFVCGAMARDIVLQHVHGIETETATSDVDFGIAIEGWDQFAAIKTRLVDGKKFSPSNTIAHRLYYRVSTTSVGYPVDIIPFGRVESANHCIEWPPDRTEIMNVIGYDEVLTNTLKVTVDQQLAIPVTSLAGLVLLKLFAWADRRLTQTKDALDIATVMKTYHEAGNEDRLFGEELKILEAAEFQMEAAGSHLLGKDVRKIARPETLNQALAMLNDEKQLDRLLTHMAPRLKYRDDPFAEAESLLKRFKDGLDGK